MRDLPRLVFLCAVAGALPACQLILGVDDLQLRDAAGTGPDAPRPDGPVVTPDGPPIDGDTQLPDARTPDARIPDASPETPNLAFVTSTSHTGALGGLAGADAICQARAQAASLPGTFKAWLSTADVNAIDRLGSASGWVRIDGKPVAQTPRDVGDGNFYYPIRLDERGRDVPNSVVAFTGTTFHGEVHPDAGHCRSWTSAAMTDTGAGGLPSAGSTMFEIYFYSACNQESRLYCFQTDHRATLTRPAQTGRIAFTSNQEWHSGGGVASADRICQDEADGNGLPGTYLALLATSGASAASRFDTSGPPWRRVDGVRVTDTAAEFFTTTTFDAPPNVSADGHTYYGNFAVWSGAGNMGAAGTQLSTCNNWTTAAANASVKGGVVGTTGTATVFGSYPMMCDAGYAHLVCMQR